MWEMSRGGNYMILISLTILIFIISLILILIGKFKAKKLVLTIGICTMLLLIIGIGIFVIYSLEIEEEKSKNINISDTERLPIPDRIICKDKNGKYKILNSWENGLFAKLYSQLYEELDVTIEGNVLKEDEITRMQEKGMFIEFDYNTKSKNFVFMLEEKEIGAIKRFEDSGQVIKTSLKNVEKIKETVKNISKKSEQYDFDKTKSYISTTRILEVPEGFQDKQNGVYQKVIKDNENEYIQFLEKIDFKIDEELPKVDFDVENVVITISSYELKDIKQNIGNIKYQLGKHQSNYIVNVLIVSKIVNTNCIYYNFENKIYNEKLEKNTNITQSAIVQKIQDDKITIGIEAENPTYIIKVKEQTYIKDYETNKQIEMKNIKIGDSIYVEGEKVDNIDGLDGIIANRIEICSKTRVKREAEKYLKDTYRVDTGGIDYKNVGNDGKGYIITCYNFDNFVYPLKLNVDRNTETFLGMGYHIQSNYGYILHEMCNITLDTKITDIDNIQGLVKTIEYIAD